MEIERPLKMLAVFDRDESSGYNQGTTVEDERRELAKGGAAVETVRYEISLSGLSRRSQILELTRQLEQRPPDTRVVLGFSTGYHLPLDSELKRRRELYVPLASVSKLAAEVEGVYLAHFTPNLDVGVPVAEQVLLLYMMAGSWLGGVQLNLPRVTPAMVAMITALVPGRELVVPMGRRTMRQIAAQDSFALDYLREVESVGATALLLDNSSGRGEPLTYTELRSCVEVVAQRTRLWIRVAGRLGLERLEVAERLQQDLPALPFGWEVESRLRDTQDRFDVKRARQYLAESYALIEQLD